MSEKVVPMIPAPAVRSTVGWFGIEVIDAALAASCDGYAR